jgi:hypothetical protein
METQQTSFFGRIQGLVFAGLLVAFVLYYRTIDDPTNLFVVFRWAMTALLATLSLLGLLATFQLTVDYNIGEIRSVRGFGPFLIRRACSFSSIEKIVVRRRVAWWDWLSFLFCWFGVFWGSSGSQIILRTTKGDFIYSTRGWDRTARAQAEQLAQKLNVPVQDETKMTSLGSLW